MAVGDVPKDNNEEQIKAPIVAQEQQTADPRFVGTDEQALQAQFGQNFSFRQSTTPTKPQFTPPPAVTEQHIAQAKADRLATLPPIPEVTKEHIAAAKFDPSISNAVNYDLSKPAPTVPPLPAATVKPDYDLSRPAPTVPPLPEKQQAAPEVSTQATSTVSTASYDFGAKSNTQQTAPTQQPQTTAQATTQTRTNETKTSPTQSAADIARRNGMDVGMATSTSSGQSRPAATTQQQSSTQTTRSAIAQQQPQQQGVASITEPRALQKLDSLMMKNSDLQARAAVMDRFLANPDNTRDWTNTQKKNFADNRGEVTTQLMESQKELGKMGTNPTDVDISWKRTQSSQRYANNTENPAFAHETIAKATKMNPLEFGAHIKDKLHEGLEKIANFDPKAAIQNKMNNIANSITNSMADSLQDVVNSLKGVSAGGVGQNTTIPTASQAIVGNGQQQVNQRG
jgi:hypothetical protein